jgi:hypothetical protein
MAKHNDQINILVPDRLCKPLFLDRIFYSLHNGVVCIASEVKNETKCQDANTLIFGREFLVTRCEWLKFPSLWIVDVQVGC